LRKKKIPMRMCVGCREMKPKKELIRIVRSPEGRIFIDPVGKASGRGAYLCLQSECFDKAKKTKALEKSFELRINDEVYNELQGEFAKREIHQ
jgi:predicted RNA-binding protein YlxR (DUF448 family)